MSSSFDPSFPPPISKDGDNTLVFLLSAGILYAHCSPILVGVRGGARPQSYDSKKAKYSLLSLFYIWQLSFFQKKEVN
jgi:hypothetical protein